MRIAATTSLPAVDRPNENRWNAACLCQYLGNDVTLGVSNLLGQVGPLVLIFGQTSMQEILVNNVEVGTIFEVGSSFEVI